MIVLDLSILNQKGTPMFNSDTFANRPAFGIVGRIFISTDTKEFFRDTGTSWELIGGPGSGTITGSGTVGTLPIWTSSSALGDSIVTQSGSTIEIKATGANDSVLNIDTTTGNYSRIEFQNAGNLRSRLYFYEPSNQLSIGTYNTGGSVEIEVDNNVSALVIDSSKNSTFQGYISAVPTLTAASNASSVAIVGVNTLSYAASFSANNIGAIYGAITGFNLQTFAGNATFANANVASGGSSVNSIDFSSGGSTITMTQSSGIRVMSGQQNLFQYQGTNSGTITHAAISQNTGFYRPTAATGILTITNAYSHLINALDDYGSGFTFINRWGIYQAGASDLNYFAANMLLGSTTNNGNRLQVTGVATCTGSVLIGTATSPSAIAVNDLLIIGKSGSASNAINFSNGSTTNWAYILAESAKMVFGSGTSSNIAFETNAGSERARITSAGNLLVGTTTDAGQKLQVIGSVKFSAGINDFESDSSTNYCLKLRNINANSYGLFIQSASTPNSGFPLINITDSTAATSYFRVDSGTGNVGINTSPGTQKLYLNGSLRIDGQTSGSAGGSSGQHLIINCDGTSYKIALLNT